MNPNGERVSPHDFQLLKVLGKGGYGKVSHFFPSEPDYERLNFCVGFPSKESIRQSSRSNIRHESVKKSNVCPSCFSFVLLIDSLVEQDRSQRQRHGPYKSRKKYSRMRQSKPMHALDLPDVAVRSLRFSVPLSSILSMPFKQVANCT